MHRKRDRKKRTTCNFPETVSTAKSRNTFLSASWGGKSFYLQAPSPSSKPLSNKSLFLSPFKGKKCHRPGKELFLFLFVPGNGRASFGLFRSGASPPLPPLAPPSTTWARSTPPRPPPRPPAPPTPSPRPRRRASTATTTACTATRTLSCARPPAPPPSTSGTPSRRPTCTPTPGTPPWRSAACPSTWRPPPPRRPRRRTGCSSSSSSNSRSCTCTSQVRRVKKATM